MIDDCSDRKKKRVQRSMGRPSNGARFLYSNTIYFFRCNIYHSPVATSISPGSGQRRGGQHSGCPPFNPRRNYRRIALAHSGTSSFLRKRNQFCHDRCQTGRGGHPERHRLPENGASVERLRFRRIEIGPPLSGRPYGNGSSALGSI